MHVCLYALVIERKGIYGALPTNFILLQKHKAHIMIGAFNIWKILAYIDSFAH